MLAREVAKWSSAVRKVERVREQHPGQVLDVVHADFHPTRWACSSASTPSSAWTSPTTRAPRWPSRIEEKPELARGVHRYNIADYGMTEERGARALRRLHRALRLWWRQANEGGDLSGPGANRSSSKRCPIRSPGRTTSSSRSTAAASAAPILSMTRGGAVGLPRRRSVRPRICRRDHRARQKRHRLQGGRTDCRAALGRLRSVRGLPHATATTCCASRKARHGDGGLRRIRQGADQRRDEAARRRSRWLTAR